MSAPTPDEVAKARAWFSGADPIREPSMGPTTRVHVRVLLAALDAAERERNEWRDSERTISNAYLRLRAIIPGAYRTPHAPTAQQVHEATEAAAVALVERAEKAERERDTLAREACRAFGSDPVPTVERALDFIRSMWVAASSDSARHRAERAEARVAELERERDEARALAVPPGAIVVRDDDDTRGAINTALDGRKQLCLDGVWRVHATPDQIADAVLAALRERAR